MARLQARFDGLVGAVKAISTAAVLVVGALRVSHGAISPGELLVFASYTRKAQSPMRSFANELTKIAATMAKADRVAELLAADDMLPEPPNAYRGARATGDVALEDVSFGYGAERPVLSGVSLRVGPGERLALMGPSGAGKSTLGALVARFFDPTDGRVLIDGRDARDCSLTWLREQVAVVLQDTVLFSGDGARQHRLRDRRVARGRRRRRARRPRRTSSSAACRRATTPTSGRRASRCRAASASASASRARCCATRRSSCSTSRPRASTPPARPPCSTGSRR